MQVSVSESCALRVSVFNSVSACIAGFLPSLGTLCVFGLVGCACTALLVPVGNARVFVSH